MRFTKYCRLISDMGILTEEPSAASRTCAGRW